MRHLSSNPQKPPVPAPPAPGPLKRALHQSERVHDKVEQAAADLSSVNAVLKDEITEGEPHPKVERAVHQSEAVEVDVQEAAAELVAVNAALAEEIDERHRLEHQLSQTDAALSQSRAEEKESRRSALHDVLTGLPNLTLFNDRLRIALAQAERHGWRLAVMFIDLDDFKVINDTRGHDFGDLALQMVARRLQTIVRAGDTVSRRSGDEFLFLMLEVKSEADVAAFAARLSGSISELFEIDGVSVTLQASIGIAIYPHDGQSAPELLKRADTAMYSAKQKKKS